MKINLLYDSDNIITGYVNVDPFQINNPNVVCSDLEDLHFCSPGEAEEIICNNILSYFHKSVADKMLYHYISRLAHKGSIVITDVNAYEVARRFVLGEISSSDLNNQLFGPKHPKKSLCNLTEITNQLTSLGLTVVYKKINGDSFVVKGIRS